MKMSRIIVLFALLLISLPSTTYAQCLVEVNQNGFEYSAEIDLAITDVIYTQAGSTCNVQVEITYDIQLDVANQPGWWNESLYNLQGNLECEGASGMSFFDLPNSGGTGKVLSATFSFNNENCADVILDCPVTIQIQGPELNESIKCETQIAAALPVTLHTFESKQNEAKNIEVLWSTETEINFSHFLLEESKDLISWNTLANIKGINATNGADYNYTIPTANYARYLRLKMIDIDNQMEHSKTITIAATHTTEISIYPNPAADRLHIVGSDIDKVSIYNSMGQSLDLLVELDQSVNVSSLTPGYYLFHSINHNGATQSIPFIKQ